MHSSHLYFGLGRDNNNFLEMGFWGFVPEDLYDLIKKAVSVRKHLEKNKRDNDAKLRLILIEYRIHRLA